jgi:hypothetical protein
MTDQVAQTSVRLRIHRLTLDGFDLDPRQARAVRRAVEAELGALLSAGALPARMRSGGSARRLPGLAPAVGAWTDAGDLGRQVARAVYGGMQR